MRLLSLGHYLLLMQVLSTDSLQSGEKRDSRRFSVSLSTTKIFSEVMKTTNRAVTMRSVPRQWSLSRTQLHRYPKKVRMKMARSHRCRQGKEMSPCHPRPEGAAG
jgi:hypothetical protein